MLAEIQFSLGQRAPTISDERRKSKMKTMAAALAQLTLAAGPVFAAGPYVPLFPYVPQPGYYGINPNSPAITGGGSIGHNWLQQASGFLPAVATHEKPAA
jgi:hypothetical protein